MSSVHKFLCVECCRFLNKLKRTIKNKARVEGSICEAYLCQETTSFCSYYFEQNVQSSRNRIGRNDLLGHDIAPKETLSIFSKPGHSSGRCRSRYLIDKKISAAVKFVGSF